MSLSNLRGITLLVVSFAVGAFAGVAADRAAAARAPAGTRIATRMPDLLDRLALTPEQHRAADSILAQRSPRSEAAMRELMPRLAAIADSVNAELAKLLTPAQRATLDSLSHGPVFVIKKKDAAGKERIDTVRKPDHP